MKKYIFLILVISLSAFYFTDQSRVTSLIVKQTRVSSLDRIELNNKVDKKNISANKNLSLFKNTEDIDITKLLKNKDTNISELAQSALGVVSSNTKCITNKKCTEFNSKHPYNDPSNTSYHRELANALELYNSIIDKDDTFVSDINSDDLLNASLINNRSISLSALRILLLKGDKTSLTSLLRKLSSGNIGMGAEIISSISKSKHMEDKGFRDIRNLSIHQVLKNSDNNVTSEIGKMILGLEISQHEAREIVNKFCDKRLLKDTESQRMLYYQYSKISNRYNIDSHCI